MTPILQRAQTTAERVRDMAVSQLAAEIDALTRERDEAQAEVERLRPAAEAWEAQEALRWSPSGTTHAQEDVLIEKANAAAARARAAKGAQP